MSSLYKIGKELGAGNYGTVNIVEKHNYNKIRFAMKKIAKEENYEGLLQREFNILS